MDSIAPCVGITFRKLRSRTEVEQLVNAVEFLEGERA
jgi:hypothetical protein